MIKNTHDYSHFDRQNKILQLRRLTKNKGIKQMEDLLKLHHFFSSRKHHQTHPVALARLLKS